MSLLNQEIVKIIDNLDIVITDFSVRHGNNEIGICKFYAEVNLKFIYEGKTSKTIDWAVIDKELYRTVSPVETSRIGPKINNLLEFVFELMNSENYLHFRKINTWCNVWNEDICDLLKPFINKVDIYTQDYVNNHGFEDKVDELIKQKLIECYTQFNIESKDVVTDAFDEYIVNKIMET